MDDQRAVLYVAAGVAAGAFLGFHLKASASASNHSSRSWCPMLWGGGPHASSSGGGGCPFSVFGVKKGGGRGGNGCGQNDEAAARTKEKEAFISRLGLIPHPEGGFFVETYRSGATPMASKGQTDEGGDVMTTSPPRAPTPTRNVMTSIYYMLTAESGGLQWWANNMSDHVHYHHAGGTLIYNLVLPDGTFVQRRLGSNIAAGDEPQLVVRGGSFKSVRLEEGAEWGIIGEGVAPGFDFRDFKFVSHSELKALNKEAYEKHHDLIKPNPESEFDHYYDENK